MSISVNREQSLKSMLPRSPSRAYQELLKSDDAFATPLLIGAMLLSPLMMPIIGLGFGIATLDFYDIRRAATALILGSLIAVTLSVGLILLSPVQTITMLATRLATAQRRRFCRPVRKSIGTPFVRSG